MQRGLEPRRQPVPRRHEEHELGPERREDGPAPAKLEREQAGGLPAEKEREDDADDQAREEEHLAAT